MIADMPVLRQLYKALAWVALQTSLLVMLLLLGLMSVGWNLAAVLLYPVMSRDAGRRLGRDMISRGYAAFWSMAQASGMMQMDGSALDSLRDEEGLIVVANHPSMIDAMLLVAHLPLSACIMKASLMRNPLLGPGARLARYIRNDSAFGMIHCAVTDLRSGGQLVLFPEGTRTTQRPLNRFHASFAVIARRAQAPVQAVFIDTGSPYLGKGWPLWRLPPLPIRFTVRLGQRFDPPHEVKALVAEVESHFAAGVRHSH